MRKRKESERENDTRREESVGTNIKLTVILPRQHQALEATNEHARAFLDPIAFGVNALLGLGGVILVILRRGLALKEERIAKWYNEGGANYWCPMGRMYVRYTVPQWHSEADPIVGVVRVRAGLMKSGRDIQLFSLS